MKWETSGVFGDTRMPSFAELGIPYFGYRTSSEMVLDTSDLEMDIFTAFILEWEFTRPSTRTERTNSWFLTHPALEFPEDVIGFDLLGVDWVNKKVRIRTIVKSGIADIHPAWVGLKNLKIGLADYLDIPNLQEIKEAVSFKTLTTQFELGHEQRRSKGLPLKNWSIILRKSSIYAEAVMRFFAEKHGEATPFWWRNPVDGMRYWVRFANPNLAQQVRWGIENSFEVGLMEVRRDDQI